MKRSYTRRQGINYGEQRECNKTTESKNRVLKAGKDNEGTYYYESCQILYILIGKVCIWN